MRRGGSQEDTGMLSREASPMLLSREDTGMLLSQEVSPGLWSRGDKQRASG